jgi:Uma2 family endonuclease
MASLPIEKTEKLTLEEFVRLQDAEGPFEIIAGERIPKMPTIYDHSKVLNRLYRLILLFLEEKPFGEVFADTTFILADGYDKDWVKGSRIPDMLYIRKSRLEEYEKQPDIQGKPLMLVPDLVIEIVSPNDSYTEIDDKVELYLKDGVGLVWVINPQNKTVSVHSPDNRSTRLTVKDTLNGSDVLPEFSIPVENIFA